MNYQLKILTPTNQETFLPRPTEEIFHDDHHDDHHDTITMTNDTDDRVIVVTNFANFFRFRTRIRIRGIKPQSYAK